MVQPRLFILMLLYIHFRNPSYLLHVAIVTTRLYESQEDEDQGQKALMVHKAIQTRQANRQPPNIDVTRQRRSVKANKGNDDSQLNRMNNHNQ